MKTHRHSPRNHLHPVKLVCAASALIAIAIPAAFHSRTANSQDSRVTNSLPSGGERLRAPTERTDSSPVQDHTSQDSLASSSAVRTEASESSKRQATALLLRVVETLALGPAFDAKVRETVWTGGREVVGVGTYEQAGSGTGRYNLQVTMHDGDGKHRLQQISDGRLAWTRMEIAGKVTLRRVDVGRLDQWVQGVATGLTVSPRLQVGAWVEMLANIRRDYQLEVEGAHLKGQPVWVIIGQLRPERREEIMAEANVEEWPMLYPTRVRVAVRTEADPKTQFGAFLPARIEFWSDPLLASEDDESEANSTGRLITLIEIYSVRPIAPPAAQRFRFENQDAEVNFTNDTDRYIKQYGVELTQRQRKQLRR